MDIPRRVVGATEYFVRAGVPKTPRDLEDHQAVIYEPQGGGPLWTFVKEGAEENVVFRGHLRTTAAEAVREAVLAGLGLAVASEAMFDPELKSGAIREVLADWRLPMIDLWAVFPSGRRVSAKARGFLAFVEKELGSGS
jgi:DNA-binding transcriptional LysR family regulator